MLTGSDAQDQGWVVPGTRIQFSIATRVKIVGCPNLEGCQSSEGTCSCLTQTGASRSEDLHLVCLWQYRFANPGSTHQNHTRYVNLQCVCPGQLLGGTNNYQPKMPAYCEFTICWGPRSSWYDPTTTHPICPRPVNSQHFQSRVVVSWVKYFQS